MGKNVASLSAFAFDRPGRLPGKRLALIMSSATIAPAVKPFPAAYRYWTRAAESLLRPLVGLMEDGRADLPIEGQVSNHGAAADRLESFARPCLWASHWLMAESSGGGAVVPCGGCRLVSSWDSFSALIHPARTIGDRRRIFTSTPLKWARSCSRWRKRPFGCGNRLSRKSAPRSPAGWAVSVGWACIGNNHLFFGVLPLSFLLKHGYGAAADRACILRWMDIMEGMHLGDGWFIDGMNESIDHYNAYAFHYYGLWWGHLYRDIDPSRAARWADWTYAFLPDYLRFFAASGEPVPFGRSMTYRFAASAPLPWRRNAVFRRSRPARPDGFARKISAFSSIEISSNARVP